MPKKSPSFWRKPLFSPDQYLVVTNVPSWRRFLICHDKSLCFVVPKGSVPTKASFVLTKVCVFVQMKGSVPTKASSVLTKDLDFVLMKASFWGMKLNSKFFGVIPMESYGFPHQCSNPFWIQTLFHGFSTQGEAWYGFGRWTFERLSKTYQTFIPKSINICAGGKVSMRLKCIVCGSIYESDLHDSRCPHHPLGDVRPPAE